MGPGPDGPRGEAAPGGPGEAAGSRSDAVPGGASPAAGDAFGAVRPEAPSARAFALCLLVCASLQVMENLLPRLPVFPWLKLGLSHIVLLPFLLRFGPLSACGLLLGRNLLTLVFASGPLTSFLIGTSSGLAALLLAGGFARAAAGRGLLGMAGAGMLLAGLMNLAQLAVVDGLFIRHAAFWFQLAPMLAWSAVSGWAVAWLAYRSRAVLEGLFEEPGDTAPSPDLPAGKESAWSFHACLAALVAIFLLPGPLYALAAVGALVAFSAGRGLLRTGIRGILRAWPWYLYLAWLHLLLGEGEYLAGGWVTRQGAEAFLLHGSRLAALVLLGPHLAAAFPRRWLSGSASPYARGLLAALPALPGLHASALASGRSFLGALRGRREAGVLRALAEGFRRSLDEAPGISSRS